MKTLLLPLFLVSLFLTNLSAQTYELDTLARNQAGPGVTYTKLREPLAPNVIYMMEVDLKNPAIKMETAKAKSLKYALERPSDMARKADSLGHRVIGIVNSDFFLSTQDPDNMQVIKGEITRKQRSGYSVVAFDTSNNYMLAYPSFKGNVITKTKVLTINDVDEARAANQLNIYNSYWGASTGTQSLGTEAVLTPLSPWFVNDTVRCIASSVAKTSGNTPIGKFQMVLSAHGSADTLLTSSIKQGDTVSVYIGVGGSLPKIRELVGGRPIFYKDGLFDSARAAGTTVMLTRNPRTIVGFSKDSTKCYILVVDGRQTYSVGMDMYEMAKLMRTLNIYHAMNFDGGGSASMVLNHAIMNKPSDGAERAVSNGLMVISTEPTVIKSATLGLPKYRMFRNDKITFSMTGYDTYNSAITLPNSKIQYSCSSRIGAIDADGIFTAGSRTDSGYVYAKYGSLSDSSFISVYGLKYFKMSPKKLVADTIKTVSFSIDTFDQDSVKHNLALSQFSWTSTNPSVGVVDAGGKFTGLKSGSTYVIAECSGYKDTSFVSVEVGRGTSVLDGLENTSGWTFSGDFMDSISVKPATGEKSQGNASFKIDYKLTYSSLNTYMIYLNKDIPVFGIPDTVFLDVKSDGRRHKLYYLFSDDNGELFRAPGKKYLDNASVFDRVHAPLSGMIVLTDNAVLNFPLTLKRIELQIAPDAVEGQVTSGTIYIDNLRLKYPGELTSVLSGNKLPESYSLSQNYPNPFNPTTFIKFTLPEYSRVNITVYDILGREVMQLLNRQMSAGIHRIAFNAAGLPSGIYIYRMQAAGQTFSRKMLLLR